MTQTAVWRGNAVGWERAGLTLTHMDALGPGVAL